MAIMNKIAVLEEAVRMSIEYGELTGTDEKYIFYYDETNNIGKLHIKESNKLNVEELSDFVLGGIVYQEDKILNIQNLRERLNLEPTVEEIKLTHIARGDFQSIISSEKLNIFLKWVTENNIYLQYSHIDLMYWSIVDIVDSVIIKNPEMSAMLVFQTEIKADLYELMKLEFDFFVRLLGQFGYPDVPASEIQKFIEALLDILEQNESHMEHMNYMFLKGVLQAAKKLDEVSLSSEAKPKVLTEELSDFYLQRVLMFKNSTHILDKEDKVERVFRKYPELNSKSNFKFKHSHEEVGIQISDVLVGVLGKLYTYVRENSDVELAVNRKYMDQTSIENLKLLNDLVEKSEEKCKAFIHHIASMYDLSKEQFVLRS